MSLGCAIIGGMLFGPVGFVCGALVNNKKETVVINNTPSVKQYGTDYIPMEEFIENLDLIADDKDIDWKAISKDENDMIEKMMIYEDFLEEYKKVIDI